MSQLTHFCGIDGGSQSWLMAGHQPPDLLTSQLRFPALLQEDFYHPRQLCIFHGLSFSTVQWLLLSSQATPYMALLPTFMPHLQPCFVCLSVFLSYGLWFSYFQGKSGPSKRRHQPETDVFLKRELKQIPGAEVMLLPHSKVSFPPSGI